MKILDVAQQRLIMWIYFSVYCWYTCYCQQYENIGCCTTKTYNVNSFLCILLRYMLLSTI